MSPLTTHIPKSKRLWHERGDNEDENSIQSSTIGIMQRKNNGMGRNESFLKARKAQSSCRNKWTMEQPHMPYLQMVRDSLPVAQEISLTIMLLALHRALLNGVDLFCEHGGCTVDEDIRHTAFVWIMFGITLAVMMFSKERNSDGNFSISPAYSGTDSAAEKKLVRYSKRILVRFGDLLLMVALLRLLSSLLRSLTASYSSDTVSNLVAMGLIVHLLACDYDYANGKCSRKRDLKNLRQIFKGGTMSLNGALLSTTLLASRLSSDFHTFAFVSLSIIAFAFYPESRSHIARHAKSSLGKCNDEYPFLNVLFQVLQTDTDDFPQ